VKRYGILDDDGQVVRWIWYAPDPTLYRFIIERITKPKLDLSQLEPALF
jgi:hypothetical protein